MAKRRSKRTNQQEAIEQRRALLLKIGWGVIILISLMFGYSFGAPLVAEGQLVKGIFIGLAYGSGALLAILAAFFLNRKLKGL